MSSQRGFSRLLCTDSARRQVGKRKWQWISSPMILSVYALGKFVNVNPLGREQCLEQHLKLSTVSGYSLTSMAPGSTLLSLWVENWVIAFTTSEIPLINTYSAHLIRSRTSIILPLRGVLGLLGLLADVRCCGLTKDCIRLQTMRSTMPTWRPYSKFRASVDQPALPLLQHSPLGSMLMLPGALMLRNTSRVVLAVMYKR